ncbi:MAG: gamma-glutamylcyclotransferase [Actinomycetota bacterium]|nr:gamma-glutamylcyclotransferase [Actinomycetota bacterium]MDQ3642342.1 gamma-glutamylcyclotransferase [Actinomycetota bacterium]
MPKDATSVFVYGTLMPGEPRWPGLRPYAKSWEPATVQGHLWDTGRGYPAARFHSSGDALPGVLVALVPRLVSNAIASLDRIEGEGVLYRRVELMTSAGPAISYEWLGPTDGLASLADGWPPWRGRHRHAVRTGV